MSKYPTSRNFGFGKQIEWAGRKALEQYYGNGHYSTVNTHAQHWELFCRWIRETRDISDAREITQDVLEDYADMLSQRVKDETMDVAYAQNLISSVNITLEAMRGVMPIRIQSPSEWVGRRCTFREIPPTGYDWEQINAAAEHLEKVGLPRARLAVLLCRRFGLRLREAVLGNIADWIRQSREKGAIDVREGTKGGRGNEVERWVPCNTDGCHLLAEVEHVCKSLGCGANMLLPDETYNSFVNNGEINLARTHLHKLGIKGYHDLRASWACERFQQLNGHPAPIFDPTTRCKHRKHWETENILTRELGHDRTEVVQAYIGARALVWKNRCTFP